MNDIFRNWSREEKDNWYHINSNESFIRDEGESRAVITALKEYEDIQAHLRSE